MDIQLCLFWGFLGFFSPVLPICQNAVPTLNGFVTTTMLQYGCDPCYNVCAEQK